MVPSKNRLSRSMDLSVAPLRAISAVIARNAFAWPAFVGVLGHLHGQEPAILVTHQVNVTALTGVYPGDGEMVVMRPGPDGHVVAGRLMLARA
jgi:hypothetical protein